MRVQRNLTTIPANSTSVTVSIATVDVDKAFLEMSYNTNLENFQYIPRGVISSPTTVTFTRDASTSSSVTAIAWQVID
ncbi:hypothetical protein [Paenibacillus sp. y28]|uniref:hypothetical protein n=1 Tax=Paenibacillus sp. y28 TaxID=3129110 RepID=UPI00301A3966